MKQIFTTGFIIFISMMQLNAQSDFRNGYIIDNNNDTIYGLVDYRGSSVNANKCTFKKEINSETQEFNPGEIKSFRYLNSKYYVSKTITVGDETKQLFLEYLINGIVDIYYYRGDLDEHYFVDYGTNKLYKLKNEEKEFKIDNKQYVANSKEYIGLLRFVFKDSPTISKKVESIRLNHKSLINISHDYHNEICKDDDCIIYEKKIPKIKSTYGFVVGMNGISFSQIRDYPSDLYYMNNSNPGFKIFPSVGFYYKVNLPQYSERIYFQYEVTYSRINYTASTSYFEPEYRMTFLSDIKMIQNTFNNFGYLRYEYPKGKFRPTFQIGGFANYFLKTDYSRYQEVINALGNTTSSGYKNDNLFSKLNYGVNLGIGLGINYLNDKLLTLDIRYQRGLGWLYELNTNTYIINAGFQIGK